MHDEQELTQAGTPETVDTDGAAAEFEELIQDLPCFLSCYRGCLVNMDRIYKTLEDSFLLDNQEVVQIRKRGANAIKKEYLNYLFS